MALPLIAAGARLLAGKKLARSSLAAKGLSRSNLAAQTETNSRPSAFSPEGTLMLAVAFFADFIFNTAAIILYPLFGLGEIVSWVGDIMFTVTLGLWMLIRGKPMVGSRIGRFIQRRVPWIAIEYVPMLGIIVPAWTISVIKYLHEKD